MFLEKYNMNNWYRKASLFEEINRLGPNSKIEGLDDPRVLYLSEELNLSKEDAFKRLNNENVFSMGEFYKRDYFTKNYGWSVPSEEAVEKLKEFVGGDNVLEIGSGYGLWAKVMQEAGLSVTATDSFSNQGNYVPFKDKRFTDIEDLEAAKALEKYGNYNVLMLSWPPYQDPMAAQAIKSFSGNKLIFIGESFGGCTANDEFFEILNNKWNNVGEINIPRWVGIHDTLGLWVKI